MIATILAQGLSRRPKGAEVAVVSEAITQIIPERTEVVTEQFPIGTVIQQAPGAGQTAPSGSSVTVEVAVPQNLGSKAAEAAGPAPMNRTTASMFV